MKETLIARFELLSLREKLFVGIALLAALWMGIEKLYLQPIWQHQKQLHGEISQLDNQIKELVAAKIQIEAQGKNNPNQKNTQALNEVRAHLKRLKQKINLGTKQFVSSDSMSLVLAELLKQSHGLHVVHLEKLPVKSLSSDSPDQSWVFLHGISLTLTGNYQNTLHYLQAIEASPWRFLWHSIGYKVQEYPSAEITIEIYTLSFQEHWLRV